MTRQLCEIELESVPARRSPAASRPSRRSRPRCWPAPGCIASEQFGLAERCLEITVAYVKERHQFARPVGGFQAIKHRLADLWVAVTQARAAARYAAACLAAGFGPETTLAVALAKAACSDTALKAAQEMIQLHGGIGFTWEHPSHLYLKRAKADSIASRHRRRAPGSPGRAGQPARARAIAGLGLTGLAQPGSRSQRWCSR